MISNVKRSAVSWKERKGRGKVAEQTSVKGAAARYTRQVRWKATVTQKCVLWIMCEDEKNE